MKKDIYWPHSKVINHTLLKKYFIEQFYLFSDEHKMPVQELLAVVLSMATDLLKIQIGIFQEPNSTLEEK